MSRLTDAFDEWVEIARECHVSSGHFTDSEIVVHPGASEQVLQELELEIGYELAPEVRELYQHANGMNIGVKGDLFPGTVSFQPIDQPVSKREQVLDLVDIIRADAPNCQVGPKGLPLQPYTIFEGIDGQVQVECSSAGSGAVSYVFFGNSLFFWVARSLTRYLEIQVEAFRNGGILWSEEHAYFRAPFGTSYTIGGQQAGELTPEQATDRRFSSKGEWRWPG